MSNERMSLARQALKLKMISDDVVFFDIQVARDIMPKNLAIDFGEIGPVRMPYPKIFMEFHEPMLNNPTDSDMPTKVGFLLSESEDGRSILMRAHFLFPDDGAMNDVFWLKFETDENGFLVYTEPDKSGNWKASVDNGRGSTEVEVSWSDDLGWDVETIKGFVPVVCALARTCLVALGLINCRNVKVWDGGRIKQSRSGSEKRRGVPPKDIRYSTIILPGGGSRIVGSGPSTHHRAAGVHRVRGHFKTYTEKAPLMGKHVGTYWWGWQIRGSVESGVVESEYVIGA